jgi:hypothetical protein
MLSKRGRRIAPGSGGPGRTEHSLHCYDRDRFPSFGRREYEMKNFVPITLRQHFDAIDLLCLASMIAVGYVLFTFGPLP